MVAARIRITPRSNSRYRGLEIIPISYYGTQQTSTSLSLSLPSYNAFNITHPRPDGWQDPRNATFVASTQIQRLDPYHPVSLVLNCQDYFFEEYSRGASIILQDTYTIEVNTTWSRVWNTPCNATLGDCGCDNCRGGMRDVVERVDSYKQRLVWSGRGRGTSVWSVPQAFGNETCVLSSFSFISYPRIDDIRRSNTLTHETKTDTGPATPPNPNSSPKPSSPSTTAPSA